MNGFKNVRVLRRFTDSGTWFSNSDASESRSNGRWCFLSVTCDHVWSNKVEIQ